MEELIESAERVEKGVPLTPELDQALFHGSATGGARPKALIRDQLIGFEDNIYCVVLGVAIYQTYRRLL